MAIVKTDNRYYAEIAEAIRKVNGLSELYTPAQMAAAILALGSSSRLPEGYTELTYIESTGTQYIDTGFKPNNNTGLEIRFNLPSDFSDKTEMFGARNSSIYFELLFYTSGSMYLQFGNKLPSKSFVVGDFNLKLDGGKLYDKNTGTILCDASAADAFQINQSLYLFALHNASGGVERQIKAKLYSCQIYDNGTLVRDYIPCINPSGEVGLYDLVTAAFFGNSGTGSFACNLDFANQTWQQIIDACQSNAVPSIWKVGNQKTMTINGTDYVVDIIGKNHDTYADGSGIAPLTFQLNKCYGTSYAMNTSVSNVSGWTSCVMRTNYLPAILALMPSEVQAGIKEVNKLTGAGNKSSTIKTTADKLFLLSEVEIFGSASRTASGEGTQYAYYANGGAKTKATGWWERSPAIGNATHFGLVYNGASDYNGAASPFSVSFAFCF